MANLEPLTVDFSILPNIALDDLNASRFNVMNALTVAGFPYVETLNPATVPPADGRTPNVWDDGRVWDDNDTWSDYQ